MLGDYDLLGDMLNYEFCRWNGGLMIDLKVCGYYVEFLSFSVRGTIFMSYHHVRRRVMNSTVAIDPKNDPASRHKLRGRHVEISSKPS